MREPEIVRVPEQALRERVTRALARHKAVTADCHELFRALEDIHSGQGLKAIHCIPIDLRRSSEDLRYALDRLSKFLLQEISELDRDSKPVKTLAVAVTTSPKRNRISSVKADLVKSKRRLSERDIQIAELIDDGLRLAFKTEALEERIAGLLIARGSQGGEFGRGSDAPPEGREQSGKQVPAEAKDSLVFAYQLATSER